MEWERHISAFPVSPLPQAEDTKMQEIMRLAHEFLQNFCAGNQQNQALLHKHINLFLNPGVSGEPRQAWTGRTVGTSCPLALCILALVRIQHSF